MSTLELIGTADAARILGLTRGGVNRRVELGTLTPYATIGPREIRVYDRAEIERLAEDEVAK